MKTILSALLITIGLFTQAQGIPYPPLSPKGSLSQVVGNTTFTIEYERPSLRNREVFDELVPSGEVWRTGAGHCTKIDFDKPVSIASQTIPAGTYSIFTIPNPGVWTIILNKDTSLYGSRDYKSSDDIIRLLAKPIKTKRVYETLTFDIEIVDNNASVSISWDKTSVSFLIETSTNKEINSMIKSELLSGKSSNVDEYEGGASFLLTRGEDLPTALRLATKAVELDGNSEWARNLKITLYERLGKYPDALDEITSTITMLKSKENRGSEINQLQADFQRISKLKKK